MRRAAGDPDLRRLMPRLPEHECSPYDLLPFGVVLRALLACLVRGRFHAIPEFLARRRRAGEYNRELKRRTRLRPETPAARHARGKVVLGIGGV